MSKKKKKTPDASSISANGITNLQIIYNFSDLISLASPAASPATSPTHQADKKADKKKKEAKKQEEQAANEKTAEIVEAAPHALAEASQVQAEPPKIEAEVVAEKAVEVEAPKEAPTPAKPVEQAKEKNNNSQTAKPKKVEKPATTKVVEPVEAAPEPAAENDPDGKRRNLLNARNES